MRKERIDLEGFFQRYLRLYRPLITSLNELLSAYELSYSLWEVVFYIKNNGPSTLVDIANQLQCRKTDHYSKGSSFRRTSNGKANCWSG